MITVLTMVYSVGLFDSKKGPCESMVSGPFVGMYKGKFKRQVTLMLSLKRIRLDLALA